MPYLGSCSCSCSYTAASLETEDPLQRCIHCGECGTCILERCHQHLTYCRTSFLNRMIVCSVGSGTNCSPRQASHIPTLTLLHFIFRHTRVPCSELNGSLYPSPCLTSLRSPPSPYIASGHSASPSLKSLVSPHFRVFGILHSCTGKESDRYTTHQERNMLCDRTCHIYIY